MTKRAFYHRPEGKCRKCKKVKPIGSNGLCVDCQLKDIEGGNHANHSTSQQ